VIGYTTYSSDAKRREELIEGLHTVADLIGSNEDFETIRAFVESVLSEAVDRLDRLEHDELANAVFDMVLDVDMHTCVDGETYCWICSQTRIGGAS
jgi:hypothetical protein